MSNVLLLSSFSEASLKAIKYALSNLSESTKEVHLAHVYQVKQPDGLLISVDDIMENALQSKFHVQLKESAYHFTKRGLATKVHVLKGSIRELLDMLIVQINARLLVLGSSGHLQKENFQANGYRIGKNTETPCLIVPKSANMKPPAQMMIYWNDEQTAIDFKHETLITLFKSVQSVKIVSPSIIDSIEQLENLFPNRNKVDVQFDKVNNEKELPKLIEDNNSDFLLWNGPINGAGSVQALDKISSMKNSIPIWIAR